MSDQIQNSTIRLTERELHRLLFHELVRYAGSEVVDRSVELLPSIEVASTRLKGAVRFLKEYAGMNFFDSLTAIDLIRVGSGYDYTPPRRFCLIYQFLCLPDCATVNLKVFLPDHNPSVDSIQSLFGNAEWHEREVHDLFGIDFSFHLALYPLLLPEGWDGFPLRKDYWQSGTALGLPVARVEGGRA